MFESSFLERAGGGTGRPLAVLASFAGQIVLVGLAVLAPLIYTDVLPSGRVLAILLAPGPPPARQRQAPAPKLRTVRQAPGASAFRGFAEPAAIPKQVAMIIEEPAGPVPGSLEGDAGVPGSIGEPSAPLHAAVRDLIRVIPDSVDAPAPPPKPDPPQQVRRVRVGGMVQQARAISRPLPQYPPLARQARIAGTVRIEAVIAVDGTVQQLRVISGHPMLIPAAMEAVRAWRFHPTLLNGEPVEVETQLDVVFTLN